MQIEKGSVLARKGNTIVVELKRTKACVLCALAQFCGDINKETSILTATTFSELKVGDRVEVAVEEDILIPVSIILYGVSLLFFLTGLFIGYGFSFLIKLNENLAILISVLFGFLFLIPGAILARGLTKKLKLNFKDIIKNN